MVRTLLVAVTAVVAVVSACAVPAERRAHVIADDDVPFELLDPDAPAAIPAALGETELVTLCFVREDRLDPVERPLPAPVDPLGAVRALALPPTDAGSPGTAVSDPSLVQGVTVAAGVARVDLGPSIAALGSADQLLAVAQIVCTLTARPGIGQIAFTVEGAPVDVPRGDGSVVAEPVSRDDYRSLYP